MSDTSNISADPINTERELAQANARLPINIDREMPLDITLRTFALTIAQRLVGDTVVREGALYNALKMDNKLGNAVSLDDVLRAALVFERYLWGEWSKGIAENAINATGTDIANEIEKEIEKRFGEHAPIRPTGSGSEP